MSDNQANVTERQDALEGRVAVLEATAVSEVTVSAFKKSMHALRETQIEHGQRLTRIEGRLDNVEEHLASLRIDVHAILDLLDTHLAKKPMWIRVAGLLKRGGGRAEVSDGN